MRWTGRPVCRLILEGIGCGMGSILAWDRLLMNLTTIARDYSFGSFSNSPGWLSPISLSLCSLPTVGLGSTSSFWLPGPMVSRPSLVEPASCTRLRICGRPPQCVCVGCSPLDHFGGAPRCLRQAAEAAPPWVVFPSLAVSPRPVLTLFPCILLRPPAAFRTVVRKCRACPSLEGEDCATRSG
ncbi:hypothetical protein BS47DRAFT_30674 [Hydnum rufescens UP504]|uniref:Uncharacterized protein n=1 Tax=Hydnum rufescens UP504 TaxID=1448309 RepID=A0A9P6B8D0_9AGAM|nr:hypothetical protein BS47DRAFT_30674 [Hydnum rufescens UP504]